MGLDRDKSMDKTIPIYVGYDNRESIAYHVFCESVLAHATEPVAFHPLVLRSLTGSYVENHNDGSNEFIYSRFLVPFRQDYKGWAIFVDGDMVVQDDISKLWALRDESKAVMVVKHNYKTKHPRKYLGTSMETHNRDYPRKNWSSVILWNCGHPSNAVITPEYVMDHDGTHLHRFSHLKDEEIGELPKKWNWMSQEYGENKEASLIHYTLGVPGIAHYSIGPDVQPWFDALDGVNNIQL